MNGNQVSSNNNLRIATNACSDFSYDDDGFFSDVPASGSLSRSLVALNKYVKKNLLYEDNENENDDGAYFSKESTPNKSGVTYYSHSAQSSDSGEKDEIINAKATYLFIEPQPVQKIVTGISNAHVNKDIQKQKKDSIYQNSDNFINSDISAPPPADKPVNELLNATEQTDDYKFKQLRDNPDNSGVKNSSVVIQYVNNRNEATNLHPENKSSSLEDLNDYGTAIDVDNSESQNVVRRDKKHVTIKENRHTVHDASDWVNRTDMYPDVYAPLPYSKFIKISLIGVN